MAYCHNSRREQGNQVMSMICNLSYTHRDKVDREVSELINHTSLNKVSVDAFVHNNGIRQNLLRVFGTLPISHRGATYNIPLTLWIPYQFPDNPPTCFVTPTQDMAIKPRHKHVNSQGLIFHPYLSSWSPYNSNLIALTTNLQSVFGPEPPVYAKPRGSKHPGVFGAQKHNQHHPSPNYQPQSSYQRPHQQPGNVHHHPQPPSYDQVSARREVDNRENMANEKEQLTKLVKVMLQSKVSNFHNTWVDEINQMNRLIRQLSLSEREIKNQEGALEHEVKELKLLKNDLETANVTLQSWLDENRDNKPINMLEVVEPATGWTNQIMNATAKDCAIDDTLYCLDRAFGDELIDVKQYLKQLRKLLREQFFLRALSLKIKYKQQQLYEASGNSMWQYG